MSCTSTYTISLGEKLRCVGEHLQGNPFRGAGIVHQAEAYGGSWTWYTDEQDKEL